MSILEVPGRDKYLEFSAKINDEYVNVGIPHTITAEYDDLMLYLYSKSYVYITMYLETEFIKVKLYNGEVSKGTLEVYLSEEFWMSLPPGQFTVYIVFRGEEDKKCNLFRKPITVNHDKIRLYYIEDQKRLVVPKWFLEVDGKDMTVTPATYFNKNLEIGGGKYEVVHIKHKSG